MRFSHLIILTTLGSSLIITNNKQGNRGSEKLSNLPKVTQSISTRTGIQIQACMLQTHILYITHIVCREDSMQTPSLDFIERQRSHIQRSRNQHAMNFLLEAIIHWRIAFENIRKNYFQCRIWIIYPTNI